jgi:hypothetical protein
MVKLSSGRQLYASLIRHNIISGTKRGSKERFVHYCGIEPNIVAAKKIVEDVIELGRQWNKAHQERYADKRGVAKGTATVSVQHSKDTVVDKEPAKLTPLHYNSFLKEIAILKERYALTVPNAHIEINVRVPSNTTV